ncbi:MAG: thiamine pyrophosphate-dependent dehydrogenase E1 component subunit alpha [bacterium]
MSAVAEKNNRELSPEILRELLRKMLLIRRFEEKIIEEYPVQDMKTPVHLYIGEEAIAAGVCLHLRKDDYISSTHRSHGHCLAKGMDPKVLLAEFYGRANGCCRGKGGSMHPAAPELGIMGTSAIVGGGIGLAVGQALAAKMRGTGRISVPFFGDGAADEGIFHECLNFASLKKLPVVFICENNYYSVNSPLSARHPQESIALRAEGYGMEGIALDGNDAVDVYLAAGEAVSKARHGGGPTLLECRTYRWKGHVGPECDHEKGCRSREELEEWIEKCPLELHKGYLEKELLSEVEYNRLVREIDADLDEAVRFARESPFPAEDELLNDLYCTGN